MLLTKMAGVPGVPPLTGICTIVSLPVLAVSKKINTPYRSGPSKSWLKTKNPKAAAAMRVIDGPF